MRISLSSVRSHSSLVGLVEVVKKSRVTNVIVCSEVSQGESLLCYCVLS